MNRTFPTPEHEPSGTNVCNDLANLPLSAVNQFNSVFSTHRDYRIQFKCLWYPRPTIRSTHNVSYCEWCLLASLCSLLFVFIGLHMLQSCFYILYFYRLAPLYRHGANLPVCQTQNLNLGHPCRRRVAFHDTN